jgi:hypothetical protein
MEKARERTGMARDFISFTLEWKKLMKVLRESKELKAHMRGKL